MRDRGPFLPFDDEDAWLPERQQRAHRFRDDPADTSESGRYPCPQCESGQTVPRHIARRIGGAVGAAAGATGAIALALSGAETGAAIGVLAGPVGAICGSLAGAILAGLIAGATGCATGAAFGEALDHNVFNNWLCLACGCTFTVPSRAD
ncbi:Uncharacterised protein [Burkholderia pseudomallei]|uniref:complement resistance protein TraT n=1 Tax=Burkholderia pseudomallei TaxID=28450 RepID=UPI000F2BD10F|nr:complement resistance protein TraT [Burkholderia pseudomallei]CAJ3490887.1 Uncharacterised protein [Burkholderia pseudomallei]CAJ5304973.1 Uncharacterised protein [Burkholderia pseudomallei]CAJ6566086.1 Uncharacterised protein [Burkholderia pseudomallei]CAJ8091729.1 Uncharacterised protein [Burkholderia pseudomallei]VBM19484.1 Uncharacterised protein [Burkholderia pseudomallei]